MKNFIFFDDRYVSAEQLPKRFTIAFEEVGSSEYSQVKVIFNGDRQVGDIISDNSYENDFYRYHDVFHYSFATLLGWSPCTRALIKCKRKSDKLIDEVEDGARAAITEEAISMIVFNEAKRKNYFEKVSKLSKSTLKIIKEMTENFEVKCRSTKQWEQAILKAYEIFRLLVKNQGGEVEFNAFDKKITFSVLA